MKANRVVFWAGLLVYLISFSLPAVRSSLPGSQALRGYLCAYVALFFPFHGTPPFQDGLFEYAVVFISGLINPLFLMTATLVSSRPLHHSARILTVVLLLMFPSCWIVFHYEHLYPGEGYFVWVVGMLLVLFTNRLKASGDNRTASSRQNW
jgi:uncharacterized membrane protein YhaH (DUF805 family)